MAVFGPTTPILLMYAAFLSFLALRKKKLFGTTRRYGFLLLMLILPIVVSVAIAPHPFQLKGAGGLYGHAINRLLYQGFGTLGRDFILLILVSVSFYFLLGKHGWRQLQNNLADLPSLWPKLIDFLYEPIEDKTSEPSEPKLKLRRGEVSSEPVKLLHLEEKSGSWSPVEEVVSTPQPVSEIKIEMPTFLKQKGDTPYQLPPLTLLSRSERVRRKDSRIEEKAQLLETTLQSFGVKANVIGAVSGPTVTRYEVQPAQGVKVSRIVNLADDIALAMAAKDVRMEAPIPGKSAIGIEIPNDDTTPVLLRDVLENTGFLDSDSDLTVGLGKGLSGEPLFAQLDKMPHLLIAGATGAGKSVCINTIICSLLLRASPEQVKLLLVDPKVVELSHFNGVPHLLAPVVTDAKKAASVLRGVLREMENRYALFAKNGVKDIKKYNESMEAEGHLPYIVVIIDELADLMMVASAEVEDIICRLAQMARAAGIHLIVATQRPSVDVITGLIKANIPSRLAFAVSSQVDSRTILDGTGAEKLLGRGDMLFAPIGTNKPLRAQGAFVSEQEVQLLIDYAKAQAQPEYEETIVAAANEVSEETATDVDALFLDALRVVVEARQASASLLQRRMRVGYSRAARLIDQMVERGYVGPQEASKPREVRISPLEYDELINGKEGSETH